MRPPFVHTDHPPLAPETQEPKSAAWGKQEWREFDWKSAASLRAPEKVAVKSQREWDSTEWAMNPVSQEARRVAEQLDGVAQKIRKGELSVDGNTPTPETAMVAALEALIRAN